MTIRSALRIAFFGSDRFSVYSLNHLLKLRNRRPELIESIDVVTRKLKPKGRNLKVMEDLPVGEFATQNNVNVLRADNTPEILDCLGYGNQFNLAIAVSYGKLIPKLFLDQLDFGGLNVHPSLLPRYSGSSPIQKALINDDEHTGVTVQTLHPTKFDKGQIISQSNPINIEDQDNYFTLEAKLGEFGGRLLANTLENGKYHDSIPLKSNYEYSLASKINPSQAQISWDTNKSRQIRRLSDALGPTYTYIYCAPFKKKMGGFKRVILQDIQEIPALEKSNNTSGSFRLNEQQNTIEIFTVDGAISVGKLTFECCTVEDAKTFYKRLNKRIHNAEYVFTSDPK